VEAPLEVVFEEGIQSAGLVDTSMSQPDDLAADKAIDSITQAGTIKELKSEYFDCAYYWDSVKEMLVDMNEKWKDDVVIPEQVVRRASTLFKKHRPHARIRLWIRMKLVVYEKQ
ncbi:MAG: hypothetical protein ABSF99_09830, partial [Anaerolineales bacterium]